MVKIKEQIAALNNNTTQIDRNAPRRCRTCRETDRICDGFCWGFWKGLGLGFAQNLDPGLDHPSIDVGQRVKPGPDWNEFCLGDPNVYTEGVVLDVKSWATSGQNDCVVVSWDPPFRTNQPNRSRSSQIYRFGVLTKDLRRKYDVVKVT